MKSILNQWTGKFEIDDEEVETIEEEFSDGDEFHVILIPEREVFLNNFHQDS